MLDADKIFDKLSFAALVDDFAAMHREPIGLVDEMLMQSADANGDASHFFVRGGWLPGKALGAKVITIFPRNNEKRVKPSIQAVYILFDGVDGSPVACLDGTALTWIKTATDSALGAKLLARAGSETLLMVGAGRMAIHLVSAHLELQPSLKRVLLWNRSAGKAQTLCETLVQKYPQVRFSVIDGLEDGARQADIVCSAVGSEQPIVEGAWIRPGAHVDLVGAYTPEMREADDELLRRASLFVDARETTIGHIGELMIPLAADVIDERDILADLSDLCRDRHPGRRSEDEITVFKNGGGGHLDLMCARILHERCLAA